MILSITPASREEALWLSSRLRPEDRQEVETANEQSAEAVVLRAFDVSTECYTIRFNAERDPVAIFGVASSGTDLGVPWLLATSEVVRGSKALLREAPKWLNAWAQRYPAGLVNVVDFRNRLHLRWVVAAGCTLYYSNPITINDHLFIPFIYN